MQSEKINTLINRAKKLKAAPKLNIEEIFSVERALGVVFPDDFKEISSKYDYEYIGNFEMYNFSLADDYSVKGGTINWRNSINLPDNCIVLGEDGFSALIMQIGHNKSTIIWCSFEDVLNLSDGKKMEHNPTIFQSFTDFFEFLLDEEEKIRAENNQEKISNS